MNTGSPDNENNASTVVRTAAMRAVMVTAACSAIRRIHGIHAMEVSALIDDVMDSTYPDSVKHSAPAMAAVGRFVRSNSHANTPMKSSAR